MTTDRASRPPVGRRTSVYPSAALASAVDAVGLPLAELTRRGIYGPPVRPVVVPLRRCEVEQVPQSPVPAPVVVPTPVAGMPTAGEGTSPTAPRTRCPSCAHLQTGPVPAAGVIDCEACGLGFLPEGA
jgi:hypothetical protein